MIAGRALHPTTHRNANVRAARHSSSGRRLHSRVQASSEPTITVKFVEEGQQPVTIECISGEEQLRAAMLDNKGVQQLPSKHQQHAPMPGSTATAVSCFMQCTLALHVGTWYLLLQQHQQQ
jgi:hypothetical protein